MAGEVNIVAIVKGEERYVFMFDDDTRAETLRMFGRYASNPELSFSWYDAAVLSQKVRQTVKSAPIEAPLDIGSLDRNSNHWFEEEELEADFDSFPDLDFPDSDDIWINDDPYGV